MSIIASAAIRTEGYTPPGPGDFKLPPIFGPDSTFEFGSETFYLGFTKPMLLVIVSAALVFLLFRWAIAEKSLVPSRKQFLGEVSYGFVRNTLGRDVIGSKDFLRFVPLLFTLFFLILFANFFAAVPFVQFPAMSHIAYPIAFAVIVWGVYNAVGIQRHGFLGYLKLQTMPSGVPGYVLPLIIPLEFLSNIVVRPITLLLRLFANMFAGHLLLVLFAVGGEFLLLHGTGLIAKPGGVVAWIMFVLISFLEILVQFLQAFIFTILAALYVSSAVADSH